MLEQVVIWLFVGAIVILGVRSLYRTFTGGCSSGCGAGCGSCLHSKECVSGTPSAEQDDAP